MRIQSDKIGKT